MGTISLQIPQVGQPDSTEDPKVASNFTTLQTWANGNVDTNNLSPTAGITAAQLAASAGILGSQLAASAGITAAQLAVGAGKLSLVNSAVNVTAANNQLVAVTAASKTVTLPAPSLNALVGVVAAAAVTGSTQIAIATPTGLISGIGVSAVSFGLGTQNAFAILQSDGTNWYIIAGGQDTGWVPLTLLTFVGAQAGYYALAARLQGDTVRLRGAVTLAANTTGIASIPVSLRPVSQVGFAVGSGLAAVYGSISGGVLGVSVNQTTQYYFDGVTYQLS